MTGSNSHITILTQTVNRLNAPIKRQRHHSQQTDTRIENEIPHILTHRRVMNNQNTWTQGREHYTLGSIRGNRGGIAWGEMPNVGEGEEGSKTHCHVCTYATILHVLHMYPKT